MKSRFPFGSSAEEQENLYQELVKDESEENRRKLAEIIAKCRVKPNDPMFLALIALTKARLAITPLPEKLEEIQRNLTLFNTRIEDNLERLTDATEISGSQEDPKQRALAQTEVWDIAFRASFAGTIVGGLFVLVLAKFFLFHNNERLLPQSYHPTTIDNPRLNSALALPLEDHLRHSRSPGSKGW
ncbi:MAG: hypothetical protein F6J86_06675 [Symploca sp. SIO1B1]|nr:hypothetical protein [Symploca sp. SIO1B1]